MHLAGVAGLDDEAHLVRVFSRTRCSCTAAVMSRDGMGAMLRVELRSERIDDVRTRRRSAMLTRRRTSSIAAASALAASGRVEQPVDGEAP